MPAQFSDFYNSLDPDPAKRGKQFERFVLWFLKGGCKNFCVNGMKNSRAFLCLQLMLSILAAYAVKLAAYGVTHSPFLQVSQDD